MPQREQALQEWFSLWLRCRNLLFCSSPAGRVIGWQAGKRAKRAGYVAGFPDVAIFEPRGIWHGLFIELKFQNSNIPTVQKDWRAKLIAKGYQAMIMPGNLSFEEAQEWLEKKTEEYLQSV